MPQSEIALISFRPQRGAGRRSAYRPLHPNCRGRPPLWPPVTEQHLRARGNVGRVAKKLHKPRSGGLSCSLLEELRRSLQHSNFFRDRHPLVQGDGVLLRKALGGLLD